MLHSKWTKRLRTFTLLLFSIVGAFGSGNIFAQQQPHLPKKESSLEKGVFLVASQEMPDPLFRHSVILLLDHGKTGTMGLIINHATEIPLSRVLPDLKSRSNILHKLFYGGPVGPDGLIFLVRSDQPLEGTFHVIKDLYWSGDRRVLEKLLEANKPGNELHVFLGHSGWVPGQLSAEIANGGWQLVGGDSDTVFDKDTDMIWRNLVEPRSNPQQLIKNFFRQLACKITRKTLETTD